MIRCYVRFSPLKVNDYNHISCTTKVELIKPPHLSVLNYFASNSFNVFLYKYQGKKQKAFKIRQAIDYRSSRFSFSINMDQVTTQERESVFIFDNLALVLIRKKNKNNDVLGNYCKTISKYTNLCVNLKVNSIDNKYIVMRFQSLPLQLSNIDEHQRQRNRNEM